MYSDTHKNKYIQTWVCGVGGGVLCVCDLI